MVHIISGYELRGGFDLKVFPLLCVLFFFFLPCLNVIGAEEWQSSSFSTEVQVGLLEEWLSSSFSTEVSVASWSDYGTWWVATIGNLSAPTNLVASNFNTTRIELTWTKGLNADTTHIVRKKDSAPVDITDGTNIYNNTGESYDDNGLDIGTHYYYRGYTWNATFGFVEESSDDDEFTSPGDAVGFQNTTNGDTSIGLSWTKGTNATRTVIRYSDSGYPATPTSGSSGYNDTGTSATVYGLTPSTIYYFRCWSWVNPFSVGNISISSTTYYAGYGTHPDPPYNDSSIYDTTSNYLNFTWERGNRSNREWVVKKTTGYPTSPTDGTLVQNSTNLYYNESSVFTSAFYTVWSMNMTNNTFSSTGLDIVWGALGLNCRNESNPSQMIGYTIEITNEDASDVYYSADLYGVHYIDFNDIPYGDDTIFVVSNSSGIYYHRVYYYDLEVCNFYNFTFYLPPVETPSSGDDDDDATGERRQFTNSVSVSAPGVNVSIPFTYTVDEIIAVYIYNNTVYGGWILVPDNEYSVNATHCEVNASMFDANTTMARVDYYYMYYEGSTLSSRLYLLFVKNFYDDGIPDIKVDIRRYIADNDSFLPVTILKTDGNGQATVYLIPHVLYKVFLTDSSGTYETEVADWIPDPEFYGMYNPKTFRMRLTVSYSDEYVSFWDTISFTGVMTSVGYLIPGNITISYSDSNSSTIDTQIYLYEIYNETYTLINTTSNVSENSFSYIVSGINTSRNHIAFLYFNNSAVFAVDSPVSIMILAVEGVAPSDNRFDIDERVTNLVGPAEFYDVDVGWDLILAVVLPIVVLAGLAGSYNVGFGILSCGLSLGLMQVIYAIWFTNSFNAALILLCPVIVVIGVLYIWSKGKGEDHL